MAPVNLLAEPSIVKYTHQYILPVLFWGIFILKLCTTCYSGDKDRGNIHPEIFLINGINLSSCGIFQQATWSQYFFHSLKVMVILTFLLSWLYVRKHRFFSCHGLACKLACKVSLFSFTQSLQKNIRIL